MEFRYRAGEEVAARGIKRKDSPLWCDICEVGCNSLVSMESHLRGKRHKSKEVEKEEEEEKGELWCEPCKVQLNSLSMFEDHRNGKKHKAKESEGEKFWCEVCNVSCNSEVMMRVHCVGSKHCRREKEMEARGNGRGLDGEKQKEVEENGNISDTIGEEKEVAEAKTKEEEEKKEYWCLVCRVKYDSLPGIVKHLNGEEHKASARR